MDMIATTFDIAMFLSRGRACVQEVARCPPGSYSQRCDASVMALAARWRRRVGRKPSYGRFGRPYGRFIRPYGRFNRPFGRFKPPYGRFTRPYGSFNPRFECLVRRFQPSEPRLESSAQPFVPLVATVGWLKPRPARQPDRADARAPRGAVDPARSAAAATRRASTV